MDAIVADRPAFLTSADGHTGWVNSAASKVAGIDQDTQDPDSGVIDRDASTGEIIGSLQEGAMQLVTAHIAPITADFRQAALQYSVDLLNRYSITAITDAAVYRTVSWRTTPPSCQIRTSLQAIQQALRWSSRASSNKR